MANHTPPRVPPRRAPGPSAESQAESPGARHLRQSLVALHAGATSTAMIGGLASYLALAHWGVPGLVAGVAGFLFALLGRAALISLGRDWLAQTAKRHGVGDAGAGERVPPRRPRR